VDDDRDSRALIADVLRAAGYATYEAETGEQALITANQETPALAVLEVMLPGLSGYEVCRRLKEDSGKSVPVVFVSGARVEAADRVAGLLVGADDYLTKPFDPGELVARVRRLLPPSDAEAHPRTKLTEREGEVLSLIADGLSQTAIADKLFISPKTVGKHVEHIFAKLGVRNSAQAVAFVLRNEPIDRLRVTDVGSRPGSDK
jgi:DNA-binding response OmpR family regulator